MLNVPGSYPIKVRDRITGFWSNPVHIEVFRPDDRLSI